MKKLEVKVSIRTEGYVLSFSVTDLPFMKKIQSPSGYRETMYFTSLNSAIARYINEQIPIRLLNNLSVEIKSKEKFLRGKRIVKERTRKIELRLAGQVVFITIDNKTDTSMDEIQNVFHEVMRKLPI